MTPLINHLALHFPVLLRITWKNPDHTSGSVNGPILSSQIYWLEAQNTDNFSQIHKNLYQSTVYGLNTSPNTLYKYIISNEQRQSSYQLLCYCTETTGMNLKHITGLILSPQIHSLKRKSKALLATTMQLAWPQHFQCRNIAGVLWQKSTKRVYCASLCKQSYVSSWHTPPLSSQKLNTAQRASTPAFGSQGNRNASHGRSGGLDPLWMTCLNTS